jgi:Glycosyltransferase family 87
VIHIDTDSTGSGSGAVLASNPSTPRPIRSWWLSGVDGFTIKRLFPAQQLGWSDGLLGITLLSTCFLLFFHKDMWGAGWDSLNYLFGSPWEFYENCKKIRGGGLTMAGTPYPPPIYLIFAVWLYPLKFLGLIGSSAAFPLYLTYWLKILTTLAYVGSAVVFQRIALEYLPHKDWARYAAAVWLSAPLALFSQFIFSQYDIFYVLLTMGGFLMFLRGRLAAASMYFGFAITFKYFPAFVFVPLLLLYEKRVRRIAAYCVIFAAPTLIINVAYRGSPAFIEGVHGHTAINRIYGAILDIGMAGIWVVYLLPVSFGILCGIAYFAEPAREKRPHAAAYLWLTSSIMPFTFLFWHPQWLMFVVPPIVLTSMLGPNREKWLWADLAAMVLFVGTVSLTFVNNVDVAMFRGSLFGFPIENSYLMADVFDWFGNQSTNVFFSGFCAYLLLQVILKRKSLLADIPVSPEISVDYGLVRQRVYIGLLIFLLPACFAIYQDVAGNTRFINNFAVGRRYGDLTGSRRFEQTFIAAGRAITQVSLLLETSSRLSFDYVSLDVLNEAGRTVATARESIGDTQATSWYKFYLAPIPVTLGARYSLRLTAPTIPRTAAVIWWASAGSIYKDGQAIVDGVPQDSDFAFRIAFVR